MNNITIPEEISHIPYKIIGVNIIFTVDSFKQWICLTEYLEQSNIAFATNQITVSRSDVHVAKEGFTK